MSTSTWVAQVTQQMGRITDKYLTPYPKVVSAGLWGDIFASQKAVLDALGNPPENLLGANCADWMGNTTWDRSMWQVGAHCDSWVALVNSKIGVLQGYIASVSAADAEVLAALRDQGNGFVAETDRVTEVNLWEDTPSWVKALVIYFIAKELKGWVK